MIARKAEVGLRCPLQILEDIMIPAAPPLAASPVIEKSHVELTPEQKFLKQEERRLDREEKTRAAVRRYFSLCTFEHAHALLEQQFKAWGEVCLLDPNAGRKQIQKIVDLAFAQTKIIGSFLREPIVFDKPENMVKELPKYTLEELYILLVFFKETNPAAAEDDLFKTAIDKAKVNKHYLDNKDGWKSAFMQRPGLQYAILAEIRRRDAENIVVKYEPRPYSKDLVQVEEKKDALVGDLTDKLAARAVKPKDPYTTFRKPKLPEPTRMVLPRLKSRSSSEAPPPPPTSPTSQ